MCSLRVWKLTFRFPLLHQCYTLTSWYHGASWWDHHGYQPASPGTLEQLQQASPTASAPVFQCSTLRREPPLVALGPLPSTRETEDPLGPEGMDSVIPALMATITQMSLLEAMLGDTSSFTHFTHPLFQPTMPKTQEVASTCTFPPVLSQMDL